VVPSMKRVMVVTDFSATADAALPYAYVLVEDGGEVHLLHVIEHEDVPNPLIAHYTPDDLATPDQRKKAAAEVEKQLLARVPKEAKSRGITTVAACSFHREVAEGIVEEAQNRKVDALVLGSHGRSGLAHLLMGSVAEHVLRHSRLPVLIVPHVR
jgi:nucleotide-binding universal stress UspA family protein